MPRFAPNKMPITVKKRYFELLREGYKRAAAARVVGVSASCGSHWFIEAGSMIVPDPGPISPRLLTQNDRIAISDGLQLKQTVKEIAASIGKSFQTGRIQPVVATPHDHGGMRWDGSRSRRCQRRRRSAATVSLFRVATDRVTRLGW